MTGSRLYCLAGLVSMSARIAMAAAAYHCGASGAIGRCVAQRERDQRPGLRCTGSGASSKVAARDGLQSHPGTGLGRASWSLQQPPAWRDTRLALPWRALLSIAWRAEAGPAVAQCRPNHTRTYEWGRSRPLQAAPCLHRPQEMRLFCTDSSPSRRTTE